jgi:hypothetical protein
MAHLEASIFHFVKRTVGGHPARTTGEGFLLDTIRNRIKDTQIVLNDDSFDVKICADRHSNVTR